MVSLTARAAETLRALAERDGAAGFGVRVQIVAGGCAGFLYDLSLVEAGADGDEVHQSEGFTLYVDRRAAPLLFGLVIDYGPTESGEGFRFGHPRARGQCGCGASFEV